MTILDGTINSFRNIFTFPLRSSYGNSISGKGIEDEETEAYITEASKCNDSEDMYLRIAEIFATGCSSVSFDYAPSDGLKDLIDKGLAEAIKSVILNLYLNNQAFIFLDYGDGIDLSLPYNPSFGSPKMARIRVVSALSPLSNNIHPSRYFCIISEDIDRRLNNMLKRSCNKYERVSNYVDSFFANANILFFRLGGVKTIFKVNPREKAKLKEYQASLHNQRSQGTGLLGKEDVIEKYEPSMSGIQQAFQIKVDDVLAKSGLDAKTLFGREGSEGNRTAEFYAKTNSLLQTIIKPMIDQLLKMLSLSSFWFFQEIDPAKAKLVAEKEKLEMEVIKGLTESIEKELIKSPPDMEFIEAMKVKRIAYLDIRPKIKLKLEKLSKEVS